MPRPWFAANVQKLGIRIWEAGFYFFFFFVRILYIMNPIIPYSKQFPICQTTVRGSIAEKDSVRNTNCITEHLLVFICAGSLSAI